MVDLRQVSIEIIRRGQSANGAYVASPTFSQYGYSWLRDGAWIAQGMDAAGQHDSAQAFHRWAARTLSQYQDKVEALLQKQASGQPIAESDYLPTRFNLDSTLGTEDWPDFQLDGYGAWLWVLVQHCQQVTPELWAEARPAVALLVRYLAALWTSPNYDCWEEFRDKIHLSTLSALYGGLEAVRKHDPELVPPHLPETIRTYALEHGVASGGHLMKFLGNENVDSSLLWSAVPFGLVDSHSPVFSATLAKVAQDLHVPGGGVYRYRADTYFGGGEWLLLAAWLAWAYIEVGRIEEARAIVSWIEAQATPTGEMPEQVNAHMLDPNYYEGWVQRWGESANPLLWSHGMYLIVEKRLREATS